VRSRQHTRVAGFCISQVALAWMFVFLACFALTAAPIKKPKQNAATYAKPAENLLIIVADIQRHLNEDVYRFPYPTDVTGQNVFRSAIVRLANYETLYPGKMSDIVALSKAQAYEKLTAYEEAARYYEVASKSADAAVARVAGEGLERTRRFARIAHQELDYSGLRTFERDLQKKIRDLDALARELKGTPYQCLALLERERAQMLLAQFYITMRFVQPYTTQDAVLQIKRNIDENRESKRRYAHHLMLADLYYMLAKEYVLKADPDGPDFSVKEFEALANVARSEYHIVEKADGYPEKLEARAKLMALEAFVNDVLEHAR